MLHSIGSFYFLSFSNAQSPLAPPETLREVNEMFQRHGVDGTGVRRLGKKSPPFQMLSAVDTASIAAAGILFQEYQRLTDEGPQTLIWNNLDFTQLQTQYMVLDVVCIELIPLKNLIGGFAGQIASGALLRAIWTLVPVAMNQPQMP